MNIYDSALMKRYVAELMKRDREQWQLSDLAHGVVPRRLPSDGQGGTGDICSSWLLHGEVPPE